MITGFDLSPAYKATVSADPFFFADKSNGLILLPRHTKLE